LSAGGSSVDGGVPSSDASQGGSSANGGASNGAGGTGASSGTGGASTGGELGTLPDASRSDGAVNAAAAVQGDKGGCGCSIPGRTVETPWSLALAAVGLLVTRRRRRRA
jgi:MYXO-CTERM domain-containing protein